MIDINTTNFEFFEDLIAYIVDWFDMHGWVSWEDGHVEPGHLTETNAIDCYQCIDNPEISIDRFTDLFINLDKYAEIVNDLSIDAAFKTYKS